MSTTTLVVFLLLVWCFTGALALGPQLLAFYLRVGQGRPGRTYAVVVGSQLVLLLAMLGVVALIGGVADSDAPGASKALAVGAIAAYAPCVLWPVPMLVRRSADPGATDRGDPQLRRAVLLSVLPFALVGTVGLCLPAFALAFGS